MRSESMNSARFGRKCSTCRYARQNFGCVFCKKKKFTAPWFTPACRDYKSYE